MSHIRQFARCFTLSFLSSQEFCKLTINSCFILQIRKLRLNKVKSFNQTAGVSERQKLDSKPSTLLLLKTMPRSFQKVYLYVKRDVVRRGILFTLGGKKTRQNVFYTLRAREKIFLDSRSVVTGITENRTWLILP